VIVAIVVAVAALLIGIAVGWWLPPHGRRPGRHGGQPVRRILLPFTGSAISRRALEAAVRLAKAENAVIMPAFLARVPRTLPLDAPLPAQCSLGMPLLEALEQRAGAQGVAVDSRIARGRSYRDALMHLMDEESFDRIIVSATANPRVGLSNRDIDWLLERAPAEIMILRPAPTDERRISAAGVSGHF
jgi:nucleotide-binding universal stress UspA family protein